MNEDEVQTFVETMQLKNKSQRADVILMIKKYFRHVARTH